MSSSFKIPKRKSPESRSIQMESPLSRLKDTSLQKMHWTQYPDNGRKPQGLSPLNGNVSSNRIQTKQGKGQTNCMRATLVLTDILKTELGLGYLTRGKHAQRIEAHPHGQEKEPATHSKQRDSPTHSQGKETPTHNKQSYSPTHSNGKETPIPSKQRDSATHSNGKDPPTNSKQRGSPTYSERGCSQTHNKQRDSQTYSKLSDTRMSSKQASQTLSNGLDSQPNSVSWASTSEQRFSGHSTLSQLNRSRPKRASDTLCGDTSQQTGSNSGQLKRSSVGLTDSAQSLKSRAMDEEEDTDRKQTPSKATGRPPQEGERERPLPDSLWCRKENSRSEDLANENKEKEKRRREAQGPVRNGEMENGVVEWGTSGASRGSVLRHSGERLGAGESPKCLEESKGRPTAAGSGAKETSGSWPDLHADGEEQEYPDHDAHKPRQRVKRTPCKLRPSSSQPKKPKLSQTEPIVLSSDDDNDEEESDNRSSDSASAFNPDVTLPRLSLHSETSRKHAQEGQMDTQALDVESVPGLSTEEILDPTEISQVPTIMELSFSALLAGPVRAEANGSITITESCISIPLKGSSSGVEVTLSLVPSQLNRYGIWDGSFLWDRGWETPTPSLLFLWVSDAQAQLIQTELSVIHPVDSPELASPFLLLTLCDNLESVLGVLLASMMQMLALQSGKQDLMHPFSQSQGLAMIQSSGRDAYLLSLLDEDTPSDQNLEEQPQPDANQISLDAVLSKDSGTLPKPSYTLSHYRIRDSYSVSIARRPSQACSRYKHQGPPRRLILFPPPPSKGGITVSTEDLECLDSGEFLNDVIIDFYLKYLMLEKAPKTMADRSHIFSSFFYKQLTRKDNASEEASGTSAQHRRHQRVRTWTRHVDIFNKDYLFVPVNQEAHWYLVVICFPGLMEPQYEKWNGPASLGGCGVKREGESRAEAEGQAVKGRQPNGIINPQEKGTGGTKGDGRKSPHRLPRAHSLPECTELGCKRETVFKRPCILIMDSLKLSFHERILKLLREYLQVEWEVRRGTPRDFSVEQMKGSHCRVPLQDNSSDCGLYLLQYVESFLQNPVVHFELPLRLEHWFPRQQVWRKRDEIRDLVLQLHRKQGGGSSSSSR